MKTFDGAQRKVQSLLEADAYQRFLQSDLYKDLLEPESPEHSTAHREESTTTAAIQSAVKTTMESSSSHHRHSHHHHHQRHSKGFLSFGRGSSSAGAVSPSRSPTASCVTMSEDVIASLMNPQSLSREPTPGVERERKSSGKSSPESVL